MASSSSFGPPLVTTAASSGVGATSVGAATAAATTYTSHAVSRSSEFLSCAKTAVKVAKSQYKRKLAANSNTMDEAIENSKPQNQWFLQTDPNDLTLYDMQYNNSATTDGILEDGCDLLRTMEQDLHELEQLVRRRGQTNDPTDDISRLTHRLETDAKDLTRMIQSIVPTTTTMLGPQRLKHYQMIQQWFQNAAQHQGQRLKEILSVRATVLQEQARRRKRFVQGINTNKTLTTTASTNNVNASGGTSSTNRPLQTNSTWATAKTYQQSPLFSMPPTPTPNNNNNPLPATHSAPTTATTTMTTSFSQQQQLMSNRQTIPRPPSSGPSYYNNNTTTTTTTTAVGGYGGQSPTAVGGYVGGTSNTNPSGFVSTGFYGGISAAPNAGYGGSASNVAYYQGGGTTGMRQRRSGGMTDNNNNNNYQNQNHHQQQQQEHLLISRQTESRVREARQAEKSLAELGTVFGKFSTLLAQQSETLSKVEDDIEAAATDVLAGHNEITTLYSLKKGNRALILKTFGLLIFFILFMRFYAK